MYWVHVAKRSEKKWDLKSHFSLPKLIQGFSFKITRYNICDALHTCGLNWGVADISSGELWLEWSKKKLRFWWFFFLFLLCRVSEISLSGNFLNNSRTFFFFYFLTIHFPKCRCVKIAKISAVLRHTLQFKRIFMQTNQTKREEKNTSQIMRFAI